MTYGGVLRGLPPFFPLMREASAFALDVALPPNRPSATAAGFLLMANHHDVIGRHRLTWRNAPAREVAGFDHDAIAVVFNQREGQIFFALFGTRVFHDLSDVQCHGCHTLIKPNRLGFVNRVKTGQKRAISACR
jgi:hypothetical protein